MTSVSPLRSPPASLDRFAPAVQQELRAVMQDLDAPLYTMVRYHLGWVDPEGRASGGDGGKGLRSTLCLLANLAAGGDGAQALPAAAALDIIHNFSLVHDDVQDRSPKRRGKDTVWRIWGEGQAINAGDALFALSRLALVRLADRGVAAATVLRLCRVLDETCLRLCEGQHLDMTFQQRGAVSVDEYMTMIGGKTAALMAAACYVGAALGKNGEYGAAALGEAGRHIGLAFQMRDDWLGVWGVPETLGKPVAEDVWGRKKSLPVVYALERAAGAQRRVLEEVYAGTEDLRPDTVAEVVQIMEALGAGEYCDAAARREAALAADALRRSGSRPDAVAELEELAKFAVERDY